MYSIGSIGVETLGAEEFETMLNEYGVKYSSFIVPPSEDKRFTEGIVYWDGFDFISIRHKSKVYLIFMSDGFIKLWNKL